MRVFLDTNVFLYAFLDQDASKKSVAAKVLSNSVREGNGCISLQVVKEFCSVMLKRSGKTAAEISQATDLFRRFVIAEGSVPAVKRALEHKERYGIQFYDALMIAAAESAHCDTILTEDLNDGQVYAGVRAVNPFAKSARSA